MVAFEFSDYRRDGKRGTAPKVCAFEGCPTKAHTRGLCHAHYNQWRKTGQLSAVNSHNHVRDGLKVCRRCLVRLPVDAFGKKLKYVTEMCKPCRGIDIRCKAYGLTRDEVIDLMKRSCDVCGVRATGKEQHIDHCHEEGHVRGVLCSNCNTALGLVKDDVEVLRGLIAYLERSRI